MSELSIVEKAPKPKKGRQPLSKPKLSPSAQFELDKAEEKFNEFNDSVKELTFDRLNKTSKEETAPLNPMSQQEIADSKRIYLKPSKSIGCKEKFNEKFRSQYEFDKEYVQFIGEHRELIGENIETWTRPYPGMPAEFWEVPTGKPVWGPRYLAEQIKRKSYHRLVMKENIISGSDSAGKYYGTMAADTTIQRLDALPVSNRKSIFMGAAF